LLYQNFLSLTGTLRVTPNIVTNGYNPSVEIWRSVPVPFFKPGLWFVHEMGTELDLVQ
jgi:hypothetical protein